MEFGQMPLNNAKKRVIMGNMTLNPRMKSDWSLIAMEKFQQPKFLPGHNLIVPTPRQPGNVPLCMLGLLPIHNHNRKLLEILDGLSENVFTGHLIVAGIFAADSFLPFADIVRTLQRAGIHKVTNFPTVAAYGTLVEKTLNDVGLGFERECETLERFRQNGFETATVLTEVKHKTMIQEEDNFAFIELAQSDKQVFSKLFNQKSSTKRLFIMPDGNASKFGKPPNVDGLILAMNELS